MRRGWLLLCLPALLAAGPVAPDPVAALAGRYSDHFRNGLVNGTRYWSDDVVEIVPVDARHAYLRFSLQFYNGHSCGLAGVAEAQGHALVYRAPPGMVVGDDEPCRLAVRREGATLAWNDAGTCRAYCGARGGLLDGSLPWTSKRRITYIARLKASDAYRRAMLEWRR